MFPYLMKLMYDLMLIIKYFMINDKTGDKMDKNPIELVCLRKEYGRFTAVDDLSLGIARNSFTGLLGPNGAGKSTTLKMITNLIRPTSAWQGSERSSRPRSSTDT